MPDFLAFKKDIPQKGILIVVNDANNSCRKLEITIEKMYQ
jgi:hypothetical protein